MDGFVARSKFYNTLALDLGIFGECFEWVFHKRGARESAHKILLTIFFKGHENGHRGFGFPFAMRHMKSFCTGKNHFRLFFERLLNTIKLAGKFICSNTTHEKAIAHPS